MMKYGLPDYAINKLKQVFKEDARISNVWLYGSRAVGNQKLSSDIDLCVEGLSLELKDLFSLENKIDYLNLPWKVDLSLKHQIDSPALLSHIQNVGTDFLANKKNVKT